MKLRFTQCLILFAGLLFCHSASAATLNILSSQSTVQIGDSFSLSVLVNTEGVGVNAAQATIQFPKDLVDVTGIDTAGSVFNFWLEGPVFSADTGRITFTGGSTSGFNGQSLPIATIRLKAKKAGALDFGFISGTITASDGSGTSVLTGMYGATLAVTEATPVVTQPEQIVRKPIPAEKAPVAPLVSIPLYPVSGNWYSSISAFSARWSLPLDISSVATVLDQAPRTVPSKSEGLFDNKVFQVTKNGTWYLHIRFRNNVGWGETTHYRLNVDTVPPVLSDIQTPHGAQTEDPSVVLQFKAVDALSGIDHYRMQVDGDGIQTASSTPVTLDPLPPGKHVILLQAIDKAGNGTEGLVDVEILPIAAPVFTPFTDNAFAGEGGIVVQGSSAIGTTVHLTLYNKLQQSVADADVIPDALRSWVHDFEDPLVKGAYYFEAVAVDSRGAISLPVKSASFTINLRPLVTIGSLHITQGWLFFIIICLLLIGAVLSQIFTWILSRKRRNRMMIAQRDVMNAIGVTKKELQTIADAIDDKKSSKQMALLSEKLDKTAGYLIEIIQHIR